MQGLGSIPENIYLKTCSTSFLEHKVSHSPPWTPSGCIEGQQLQQHRIQLLQRQMANELVIENSLIKELKLSFVSKPSWACFCLLEQYQAGGTLLGPDLKWTSLLAFVLPFPWPQPGFLPWLQLTLLFNNDLHCPQDWGQRRWGDEDRTDVGTVWWLPLPGNILSACLVVAGYSGLLSLWGVMMLIISSVLSGHRWTKRVPRKLEEGKGGTGWAHRLGKALWCCAVTGVWS